MLISWNWNIFDNFYLNFSHAFHESLNVLRKMMTLVFKFSFTNLQCDQLKWTIERNSEILFLILDFKYEHMACLLIDISGNFDHFIVHNMENQFSKICWYQTCSPTLSYCWLLFSYWNRGTKVFQATSWLGSTQWLFVCHMVVLVSFCLDWKSGSCRSRS